MNPSQEMLNYPADLLVRLRELALASQNLPIPQPPAPSPSTSKADTSQKKVSVGSAAAPKMADKKQSPQTKAQKNQAGTSTPHPVVENGEVEEANETEKDPVARQLEVLKKLLECPICLQIPGTPMYLCTQGHSVCHGCKQKILKCPMCQHPILNTRNLLVEQIIGTLDTKCIYAGEGCTASVLEDVKKKHQSNCHYRPFECNFAGSFHICKNVKVKYSNFVKHMMNVHNMNGIKGTILNVSQYVTPEASKLATDIPWHEWPVQYMEACNQTFITGSTISEGTIFWWLYVFGDRPTADKYHCKIVLQNKAKGLELSWSGPVFHIRMRPNIIKKTGMCLMANKEALKSVSYSKVVKDNSKTDLEKVAWDLVFSVYKKSGPAPAMSTPTGLNMIS